MRRRLANFLTLFPGHTAVNIYDVAYGDWEALARETDQYIADRSSAAQKARHRRR